MLLPVNALDLYMEPGAGFARDEDSRPGARRTARPVRPGLDPWPAVCGKAPEIELVWCAAAPAGMRPLLVVPFDRANQVAEHDRSARQHCFKAQGFFQCPDEPFDHGDAAVLANGAETWFDAVAFAPAPISLRREELPAFVADQVPWGAAYRKNRPSQKSAQVDGGWR